MKNTSIFTHLLLTALLVAGVSLSAQAAEFHPYEHDNRGYFDEHHHHHAFVTHNHHRGYWDSRSGSRIFVNID